MTFAFFVAFKIYATSHVMLNTISSHFETSIFLAVQSDNSVLGTLSYIFRKKFRDKLGTFFNISKFSSIEVYGNSRSVFTTLPLYSTYKNHAVVKYCKKKETGGLQAQNIYFRTVNS